VGVVGDQSPAVATKDSSEDSRGIIGDSVATLSNVYSCALVQADDIRRAVAGALDKVHDSTAGFSVDL
jgi:hypothetical protein